MRRHLPFLFISSVTVACAPTVQTAGHTITPEETQKTGSAKRVAPPSSQEDSPGSGSTPITPSNEPPPRDELYAQVPEDGKAIGSTGPIAVEGLGRGGHWVAHCELPKNAKVDPRATSKLSPELYLTYGGSTHEIDALLTADESGRYVVVLFEGKPTLVDAVEGKRADLSSLTPDLRSDLLAAHRSFAFARETLVVLKESLADQPSRGWLLPLHENTFGEAEAKAQARPIEFGERPVWRLGAAEQSFYGVTLGKGTSPKRWPIPPSDSPTHRCLAPTSSYDAYERVSAYRPDQELQIEWAQLPTPGTEPVRPEQAPGFVAPYKDGWIRREDSGRLLLVRNGTQQQIASERCGARILRADHKSGLFFIACEEYTPVTPKRSKKKKKPKYRFDLYLIRPGFVRRLKADVARTGVDFLGDSSQMLFPVRPGASAALVDFKGQKLIPLEGELQVVLTSDTRALLRRGERLSLWSKAGEEEVEAQLDALSQITISGSTAAIDDQVFRLQDELSHWKLPAAPIALSAQGYALVPKKAPSLSQWPEGPLLLIGPPPAEEPSNESATK